MNHSELMPAGPTNHSRPDHQPNYADHVLQETNQTAQIVTTLINDLDTLEPAEENKQLGKRSREAAGAFNQKETGQALSSPLIADADREAAEEELRRLAASSGLQPDQAGDSSVLHKAFVLHHDFYRDLRKKLENHAVEVKDRQNKIKFVHGIMQEMNNYIDEKGALDLADHPDLQQKLQAAKDMGISIAADQVTFTSFQTTRLIENLNSTLEDWNTDNRTQLINIEHIFKESEQSVLLVKYLLTIYRDAIKAMCAGMK